MSNQEVDVSLSVDMDQEDDDCESENKEERWSFDTGATIHITNNKRNLCDCETITQVIKVAEGSTASA
jgi:hypothetical protein